MGIRTTSSLGIVMLLVYSASAFTDPIIVVDPPFLEPGENLPETVLRCNLTNPPSPIEGHVWKKDGMNISATSNSGNSTIMEYKLTAVDAKYSGEYSCHYFTIPVINGSIYVKAAPGVSSDKKSEHGNEGDIGVLTCKSSGYPPVDSWLWSRKTDQSDEVIANKTMKFEIRSTSHETQLRIHSLNIKEDQGDYVCNATNEVGTRAVTIHLRVRGRFAAFWPFLGIVAEVIVLVAIIFIYEKRRKPDEISDDDEQGSAPLKSNASLNHKDKNIRQRNSN